MTATEARRLVEQHFARARRLRAIAELMAMRAKVRTWN